MHEKYGRKLGTCNLELSLGHPMSKSLASTLDIAFYCSWKSLNPWDVKMIHTDPYCWLLLLRGPLQEKHQKSKNSAESRPGLKKQYYVVKGA